MTVDETSTGGLYLGKTRLFTYARGELSDALKEFYNEDARRRLGDSALRLASSDYLSVYKVLGDRMSQPRRRPISAANLALIQSALRGRTSIHPTITDDVRARANVPYKNAPASQQGLEILLHAQLDEMTCRVLGGTALVGQSHTLELGLAIPRNDLLERSSALTMAGKRLKGLLYDANAETGRPIKTDPLRFSSPSVRG